MATRKSILGIAAIVVVAVIAVVLVTTLGGGGDDSGSDEKPLATPLSKVDTTTMAITRGTFCDRVPSADVTAALGGTASKSTSYGPGDKAQVTPDVRDIAHEYSCTWTGSGGRTASGWIFAPPVTRAWASKLNSDVPKGCQKVNADDFGAPSSALRCGRSVTFRGLFGDAWLSCSLTGAASEAPADVLDRAGRWCVSVAQSAA